MPTNSDRQPTDNTTIDLTDPSNNQTKVCTTHRRPTPCRIADRRC